MKRRLTGARIVMLSAAFFLLAAGCVRQRSSVKTPQAPLAASVPELQHEPRLIAIVLDDAGNTRECLREAEKITFPITLAVLPFVPCTEEYRDIQNPNAHIIAHLPLQAEKLYPGPGTLYASMTDEEIKNGLNSVFDALPGVRGFNNHMGSFFMQDARCVAAVFSFAKEKNLFFLNSLTSRGEIASEIAAVKGIPYLERDVFLDNRANADYIRGQFDECLKIAETKGWCIAQGHVRALTIEVLSQAVPLAQKEGFQFVFLEDLVSTACASSRKSEKASPAPTFK